MQYKELSFFMAEGSCFQVFHLSWSCLHGISLAQWIQWWTDQYLVVRGHRCVQWSWMWHLRNAQRITSNVGQMSTWSRRWTDYNLGTKGQHIFRPNSSFKMLIQTNLTQLCSLFCADCFESLWQFELVQRISVRIFELLCTILNILIYQKLFDVVAPRDQTPSVRHCRSPTCHDKGSTVNQHRYKSNNSPRRHFLMGCQCLCMWNWSI